MEGGSLSPPYVGLTERGVGSCPNPKLLMHFFPPILNTDILEFCVKEEGGDRIISIELKEKGKTCFSTLIFNLEISDFKSDF